MNGRSLLAALALDQLGEPRPHPVSAMGAFLTYFRRRAPRSPAGGFWAGAGVVVLGAGLVWAGAKWALGPPPRGRRPTPDRWIREGLLLKPTFAAAALVDAGARVLESLERDDLATARQRLSRDLVSRDTATLLEPEIVSATIESLTENFVDSVIGPLCAYALGGVPAAYVYRFVNTADSVLGYRTEELEWFGKTAARTDDLINLIPARLGTAALVVTRPEGLRLCVRQLSVEARKAPSPNSGWPMATAALMLGVRLEKPCTYVLNPEGIPPSRSDLRTTLAWVRRANALSFAVVATAAELMRTRP